MKKTILITSAAFMLLGCVTFISCQKDNDDLTTSQRNSLTTLSAINPISLTVSTRGYLVFNTQNDVDNYVSFLLSSTLAQVEAYHKSIGFESLSGNKYDNVYQDSLVTDNQLKDFILDSHGLVQVNNSLIKTTDDDAYILTLQSNVVNDRNYGLIANGTFDVNQMNKFATTKQRTDSF